MPHRSLLCGTASMAALLVLVLIGSAAAFDEAKYPDLKGQWLRAGNAGLLADGAGGIRWDPSKPPSRSPSLGDPSKLMCGRPAPCRPALFRSDTPRVFPLTDDEKHQLHTMYP
jgi:hypothetical protein